MKLFEALEIEARDVVSLVGGGGKTTVMYHLASELAQRGDKVVITTTTKIRPPSRDLANYWILIKKPEELTTKLGRVLSQSNIAVVASSLNEAEGKLESIETGLLPQIREFPGVFAVLIEADGAKGKPFKAPASYEPVIPACTTLVVSIVGIDALGQPLSAEKVHRPDQVTRLTSLELGAPLTADIIAKVMLSPQGNIKGTPPHARIIPLINKVDDEKSSAGARLLAAQLLSLGAKQVVLTSFIVRPPYVEIVTPTS